MINENINPKNDLVFLSVKHEIGASPFFLCPEFKD